MSQEDDRQEDDRQENACGGVLYAQGVAFHSFRVAESCGASCTCYWERCKYTTYPERVPHEENDAQPITNVFAACYIFGKKKRRISDQSVVFDRKVVDVENAFGSGVAGEAKPGELFECRAAVLDVFEFLRWLAGGSDGQVPLAGVPFSKVGCDLEVNPLVCRQFAAASCRRRSAGSGRCSARGQHDRANSASRAIRS